MNPPRLAGFCCEKIGRGASRGAPVWLWVVVRYSRPHGRNRAMFWAVPENGERMTVALDTLHHVQPALAVRADVGQAGG